MTDTNSKIERLEAENEELRQRLDQLEETIETAAEDIEVVEVESNGEDSEGYVNVSRRGTLAAIAGAGVLGLGATGSASAQEDHDHFGENWEGTAVNGLVVNNNNTQDDFTFGLQGRAESPRARGIAGFADNESGQSVALFGRNSSSEGRAIRGFADADEGDTRGILGTVDSPDGIGIEARNEAAEGETVAMRVDTISDDGVGILSESDVEVQGDVDATGRIHADGDLEIEGTKHFVQAVETPAGPKKVRYTSVEAGRPHTELTDVAEMEDGRAEIDLPEHFDLVTSDEEPISVQVTPYATEEVKPQVVERSTERIVVEDFSDEPGEYSFGYTVKGVREGFEDKEVLLEDE